MLQIDSLTHSQTNASCHHQRLAEIRYVRRRTNHLLTFNTELNKPTTSTQLVSSSRCLRYFSQLTFRQLICTHNTNTSIDQRQHKQHHQRLAAIRSVRRRTAGSAANSAAGSSTCPGSSPNSAESSAKPCARTRQRQRLVQ
jgi:K+-sensing histidine kinase KdpD